LSDPDGKLATPLAIIEAKDDASDIAAIVNIINQHQVGQVIVGLPRLMNGSLGSQAEKVKSFAQRLTKETGVPIEFRDERLTTVSAQRVIRESPAKHGKHKGKARDDAIAAAILLQAYLEENQELDIDAAL
jgi:putative Holliday junction resolvase